MTETPYCITLRGDGLYRVRVPMTKKGTYDSKDFHSSKYMFPESLALDWRDKRGVEIWGEEKWNYIVTSKSVRMFWGKSPINVYRLSGKWVAYWRLDGKPYSKEFDDEQEAREFARKKKLELAFTARCYMKNLSPLGKYKVKNGN